MSRLQVLLLEGCIDALQGELQNTQNAFVHMVCKLTDTKPEPCQYGDPDCAGDVSEEATKIVDKVLSGEMKLYSVDEVNTLKMTVEEGSKIIERLKGLPTIDHSNCGPKVGQNRPNPTGVYYSAQAESIKADFEKRVAELGVAQKPKDLNIGTGQASEASGEAATEPWKGIVERSFKDHDLRDSAWFPNLSGWSRGLAKEAYEAGHKKGWLRGYQRAVEHQKEREKAAEESKPQKDNTAEAWDLGVASERALVAEQSRVSEESKPYERPLGRTTAIFDAAIKGENFAREHPALKESLSYQQTAEVAHEHGWRAGVDEGIRRQLDMSAKIQYEKCRQAQMAYPLLDPVEGALRKYEKDYNLVTLLKVAEDQAFDKGERKGHVEGYQEGRNDGWALGREEGAAQVFDQGVARGREIEREAVIGESIAKGESILMDRVKDLIEKVRKGQIYNTDPVKYVDTTYLEGGSDFANDLLDELEGKSLKEGETTLGAPLDKVVDLAADSGGIQGCEMLPIYGTRDAKTWAEQYLKWVDGRGFSVLPGEEYETFRWFANAIGTGFDLGVKSEAKRNSLNGGDAS